MHYHIYLVKYLFVNRDGFKLSWQAKCSLPVSVRDSKTSLSLKLADADSWQCILTSDSHIEKKTLYLKEVVSSSARFSFIQVQVNSRLQ